MTTVTSRADLIWKILNAAWAKTAQRQRWTLRHILQKAALFAAIIAVAWATGQIDELSTKGRLAILFAAAAAIVFALELVYQSYVATYEAGRTANAETARLKELYANGRRFDQSVPRPVLDVWADEVAEELGRSLPSEQFGFQTAGDQTSDRLERLSIRLVKLRAIIMRVDKIPED